MSEDTVFSDTNVTVTTTRVIMGATTYALRNITSVKMAIVPAKQGCAVLLLVIGIILGMIGLGVASQKGGIGGGIVVLLVAAAAFVGAIFWLRGAKPTYYVAIASASGEARALESKDKAYIERIVRSINDAIVRHQ